MYHVNVFNQRYVQITGKACTATCSTQEIMYCDNLASVMLYNLCVANN